MRGIHRYASDGFVLSLFIHMIREYLHDRYRHNRWLAWFSGIVLFIFSIILGITGYWLVWDERAQLIAFKTSELFNDIPLLIEPLPMSFLNNETLNRMIFFLLHLIHLGLPVAMIILIGVHVMRCSRPILMPPKVITISVFIMLFALSITIPATSAPPANLNRLPMNTPFDWYFFFIFPAMSFFPKTLFWLFAIGGTVMLFVLPWTKGKRPPAAKVILENCTGCDQCNKDCPFNAIYLKPRMDESHMGLSPRKWGMEAVVISERCASCGICVGACDFNAINLPHIQFHETIDKLLPTIQKTNRPIILFILCEQSVHLDVLDGIKTYCIKEMPHVKAITVPCIGMVQSSMIERGFKSGIDGVLIWSCIIGDCHYRKGNIWLQSRIRGERPPLLKRDSDRWMIREFQGSPMNAPLTRIVEEIHLFERDIKLYHSKSRENKFYDRKVRDDREGKKGIFIKMTAFSLIPAVCIIFLSAKSMYSFYNKNSSLLKFTFKYSSRHTAECKELTEREMDAKLKHMRKTNSPFTKMRMDCSKRERLPISVELDLDNKNVVSKKYYPAGLRRDGATFIYEEFALPPGSHWVKVRVRDFKADNPLHYAFEKKVELKPGRISIIDLSNNF